MRHLRGSLVGIGHRRRRFVVAFEQALAELAAGARPRAGDVAEGGAPGPVALAHRWWRAEQTDLARRSAGAGVARVGVIWQSFVVVQHWPEARGVVVDLGARLDADGRLEGPYDERLPGRLGPLDANDPGPCRLGALVTLAAYGVQLRDRRAGGWVGRARAASAGCPDAATALALPVRALLDQVLGGRRAATHPA